MSKRKHKQHAPQPVAAKDCDYATGWSCGCIVHPVAGRVRQCGVFGARSTHGKLMKLDADVNRHNNATIVHYYPVAKDVMG